MTSSWPSSSHPVCIQLSFGNVKSIDVIIWFKTGPLVDAKIVREKMMGISQGFGFVEYHFPDDAFNAMSIFDGFKVQDMV